MREIASGIRIIENFRMRQTPAAVLGDSTIPPGLVTLPEGARWHLDKGSSGLQQLYSTYLKRLETLGIKTPMPASYPLIPPTDPDAAALWRQFSQDVMTFVPSAGRAQTTLWQSFLTRRYQTIKNLNDLYQTSYAGFDEITLPSALPTGRDPLRDWAQFESIVLGMQRSAHRFSVLLPQGTLPEGAQQDIDLAQQQRLELARRVIELEKPAHTTFEIKFYWALFRVGGVRLDYDTVLGLGSRAPELMTALVLGRGALMEGYITSTQPARPGSWQTVS